MPVPESSDERTGARLDAARGVGRRLHPDALWLALLLFIGGVLLSGCTNGFAQSGLLLASWNLEHLAAADGAGCRARTEADYAALRKVAATLRADVIAVQEVENAAALARVFDPAVYDVVLSSRAEKVRGNCRGSAGPRRTPQHTGFVIHRERLSAQGLGWRVLPPFRDIGVEGRRWGARIRIEPLASGQGGNGLELMSLHLKSGCAWGRLDARNVRRGQCLILRRQRGILEQWIDERAAADAPFVLIGDFNRQLDQPHDDFWNAIDDGEVCVWREDRLLGRACRRATAERDRDADLMLANAGVPFAYPYNPKYPYAVDHFVFSGGASAWVASNSYRALGYDGDPPPSDHHPIRILVRLPWADQPQN